MNKWIIIIAILANVVIMAVYTILSLLRKQKPYMLFFFAALPLLGPALYFAAGWMYQIRKSSYYDRESLVKRLDMELGEKRPSVERELNIIPVEDAMAISSNEEKRGLLLEQLKKGVFHNYKTLLPAGNDEDSESAHYVAAAKMKVYSKLYAQVKDAAAEYAAGLDKEQEESRQQDEVGQKSRKSHKPKPYVQEDESGQNQHKKLLQLLEALLSYMDSSLLSEKETTIYQKNFCRLVETHMEELIRSHNKHIIEKYVTSLVDLGNWEKIEEFWETYDNSVKTEKIYFSVLRFYYQEKEEEKFYRIIDQLKEADGIELSAEGLNILRYWLARRTRDAS